MRARLRRWWRFFFPPAMWTAPEDHDLIGCRVTLRGREYRITGARFPVIRALRRRGPQLRLLDLESLEESWCKWRQEFERVEAPRLAVRGYKISAG